MFKKSLICLLMWLGSNQVTASVSEIDPSDAFKSKLRPVLNQLTDIRFFVGPTGWIGIAGKQSNGQAVLMYADNTGRYLMTGMVLDLDAKPPKNLTLEASNQLLAGTNLGKQAGAVLDAQKKAIDERVKQQKPPKEYAFTVKDLQSLPYIETGSGPSVIYGFVDMTCAACRASVREVSVHLMAGAKGRLRMRWIPVSNGHEVSTALAAQILGASDREDMLKSLAGEGKQVVNKSVAAKGAMALEKVLQFTLANKMNSWPVFVSVAGDKYTVQEGYGGLGFFSR